MISPAATRVMRALLVVHARDGRATVRSVAAEAGRSLGPVHRHLRILSDEGLIAGFGDGCQGALRPLVSVVPLGCAA